MLNTKPHFMFSWFYRSFGEYRTIHSGQKIAFENSNQSYFSLADFSASEVFDLDAYRRCICKVGAYKGRNRAI